MASLPIIYVNLTSHINFLAHTILKEMVGLNVYMEHWNRDCKSCYMKVLTFPKACNKFCLTCGRRRTAQQEDLLFFLCSEERCKEGGICLLVTHPILVAILCAIWLAQLNFYPKKAARPRKCIVKINNERMKIWQKLWHRMTLESNKVKSCLLYTSPSPRE